MRRHPLDAARPPRHHGTVIHATMQDRPLTVRAIFEHGRRVHPRSSVATFDGTTVGRRSFADIAEGADRLAAALLRLGIQPGEAVATLCWNHDRHLEAYFAVPCSGAVLHTLNLRLTPDQLAYVIGHAGDRALIVDASLLYLLEPVAAQLTTLEHVIVVGGGPTAAFPQAVSYDDVVAGETAPADWPELDERWAAAMCYTTGTTGLPKGVVYSHRSTFIHTLASCGANAFGLGERDTILLIVPMFHANAWGLPYSGWFVGADLVLPQEHLQGEPLSQLIASERITFTAGVPTILDDVSACAQRNGRSLASLRVAVCGGSAVPRRLVEEWRDRHGVPVLQGWGMTETSPIAALAHPPKGTPPEEETEWRVKQGRPVHGIEIRIADPEGNELPRDGVAVGEIQVRGPWVAGGYHREPSEDRFQDGWLRTGDVGVIDDHGYVQITDRLKDVIKSGGEWISSLELEDHLLLHPGVQEVAVIAVADARWQERPLACVVARPGAELTVEALRAHLEPRVARWWIPERWAFVEAIPKTSVGKIDKKLLRAHQEAGDLPVVGKE